MSIWDQKIVDARKPLNLRSIPNFAPVFFLRNMGSFRSAWLILSACSAARHILAFLNILILSHIISRFGDVSRDDLLFFYGPAWFLCLFGGEALDYVTRRFGEALPVVFADVTARRFYAALLQEPTTYLRNMSKETLLTLVTRYVAHVQAFLHDCEWRLVARLTRFVLIIAILAIQSPLVLLANALYIVAFLFIAFQLSARFSTLADAHSRRALAYASLQSNMVLNLNFIQRLGLADFLHAALDSKTLGSWQTFDAVRRFHAKRWLIQLNLFNLMYFGTLMYGVLQVKEGALALGFLLLIKWSFDELWQVLVYAIEYYVSLIQQRADAMLLRSALSSQGSPAPRHTRDLATLHKWSHIELLSAEATFIQQDGQRMVSVKVPHLSIKASEWIGIIGPSGAGKSTALLMLMNMLEHSGTLAIDGTSTQRARLSPDSATLVSTSDPLFQLSLRDNLSLGRALSDDDITRALDAAGVDFAPSLDAVIGSPDFNLSAGQEQRIRLARGLLHPGSLLLLDEPFTALDQQTKQTVYARIKGYLRDKTVVLVTHAHEDLTLVDRKYEMRSGVLEEQR